MQKLLAAGRVPLILDPGLTFGTGSHATTRLCLTALDQRIHGGERVLDWAAAAAFCPSPPLRLGAKEAFACDIDDKCRMWPMKMPPSTASAGMPLYRPGGRHPDGSRPCRRRSAVGTTLFWPTLWRTSSSPSAPAVRPLLAEYGVFLCSGIIDDRAEEVAEKLRAAGLEILETHSAEGWFSYLCR